MWDNLYDQHVDPKSMIDALAAKNATLVLSYHVVFEIAKIFLSLHPGAKRADSAVLVPKAICRYRDTRNQATLRAFDGGGVCT